jgi:putative MATE family efflux protein
MSIAEAPVETPRHAAPIQGTLRPLLILAWPVLIEQLLTMLLGFSDTWLVGHYLDASHLAAMTSLNYLLWLLPNLFALVSIGATAMVARFVGAGDRANANRVMHQAFVVGAALAVVMTILGFALGDALLRSMQLRGGSVGHATRFLHFLLPVMPFMMLEVVGISCLRGAGDTVTGLITMILVNVVGISTSWLLMLGVGPLPELGWDGVAIGTACGHVVGGLVPLARLIVGRAGLRLRFRDLRFERKLTARLLHIGIPGGADILFIITGQLVFLSLVNRLGDAAAAAHGLAIRLESLGYLPGVAFQVAATTLCGQYLGMRDYRRATRTVLVACLAGGGLMSAAGLVMYTGAYPLVHLFLGPHQTGVAELAAPCLRVVSTAMLPLAILMVLTGALRGAGDTRWPLVFSVVGFAGVRMPLAILLTQYWQWGVIGAWYAMAIDLTVRALLVIWRFLHGGWRRVQV